MKAYVAKQFARLPLRVQAVLRGALQAAEGAVVGFLLQWYSDPEPLCFTKSCLRHFAGAIGGAIVVAVRNYFKASPETLMLRKLGNGAPSPAPQVPQEKP